MHDLHPDGGFRPLYMNRGWKGGLVFQRRRLNIDHPRKYGGVAIEKPCFRNRRRNAVSHVQMNDTPSVSRLP